MYQNCRTKKAGGFFETVWLLLDTFYVFFFFFFFFCYLLIPPISINTNFVPKKKQTKEEENKTKQNKKTKKTKTEQNKKKKKKHPFRTNWVLFYSNMLKIHLIFERLQRQGFVCDCVMEEILGIVTYLHTEGPLYAPKKCAQMVFTNVAVFDSKIDEC